MQMGMVGLGRMGANMVRRLLRGGHECVVFNRSPAPVKELVKEGAIGAFSLDASGVALMAQCHGTPACAEKKGANRCKRLAPEITSAHFTSRRKLGTAKITTAPHQCTHHVQ
jgi:pyrroline-5-carboxylate reductase